jgi:hypothetical protein
MRLKFKKGDIPLARAICVDLLGPPDGDDFDGNGYGSVDIAEILSGAYEAQRERIAEQDAEIKALREQVENAKLEVPLGWDARIRELEAVAEAAVEAQKFIFGNGLREALRAAGYLQEQTNE